MKKMKQILYTIALLAFVSAPLTVSAAGPVSDGFDPSQINNVGADAGLSTDSVYGIIVSVMYWLLGLVGVLGVIGFVISGILYLTAAGDEEQVEKAKTVMMYSIIGVVVALIGLVILNAVSGLVGSNTTTNY